ncbi:unnamed protein product [Staurois parvus]|uniref:Uncharacterized protein n=1 Tax=Staurois parvus TaxID=386267 RepID=A0ABN9HIX9_9NEOB|nr:unnamed protein product [Staurois parvus]
MLGAFVMLQCEVSSVILFNNIFTIVMLWTQGRTDNSWGPPGNRGSRGPYFLAQTQKKPMKRVLGASHGAPY